MFHEYLDTRYLASCHVGTPDPRKCCYFGQQLIIRWSFPASMMKCDLYLVLKVRNRNETVEERRIEVKKRKGTYVYRLVNQAYCERNGILTYQVEVRDGDCVLETWTHQVWAELIEVTE